MSLAKFHILCTLNWPPLGTCCVAFFRRLCLFPFVALLCPFEAINWLCTYIHMCVICVFYFHCVYHNPDEFYVFFANPPDRALCKLNSQWFHHDLECSRQQGDHLQLQTILANTRSGTMHLNIVEQVGRISGRSARPRVKLSSKVSAIRSPIVVSFGLPIQQRAAKQICIGGLFLETCGRGSSSTCAFNPSSSDRSQLSGTPLFAYWIAWNSKLNCLTLL